MELIYLYSNNEIYYHLLTDEAIIALRGNNDVLRPIIVYLDCKSLSAESIYFLLIICYLLGLIRAFLIV